MNEKSEHGTDSSEKQEVQGKRDVAIDFLLTLVIFFLFAGNAVPDVNEPHYWTKALHYWNNSYGTGDLFLESGDAHWAFYLVFGAFTTFLPLTQAVWVGRWLTWILLAAGWTFLVRGVFDPNVSRSRSIFGQVVPTPSTGRFAPVAALAAPLWLAGMHWGNWAGEWVVGGCESKGIAYAFFFLGIGFFLRARWTLGWGCIGLGSMFHVVTGLWVIATVGLASVFIQLLWDRVPFPKWLKMHLLGWGLVVAGFLAGAVPALQMDLHTPTDDRTQAAVAQVYKRLGHHLSPSLFNETRWRGFLTLIGVTAVLLLLTRRSVWSWKRSSESLTNSEGGPSSDPFATKNWTWVWHGNEGFRWIATIALLSFGCAMFGLAFDLVFSPTAPRFAASILRFYWFRWNEVVWPLAISLIAVAVSIGYLELFYSNVRRKAAASEPARKVVATLAMLASIALIWERVESRSNEFIPPGEKQTFASRGESRAEQRVRFDAWIAACSWIRENIKDDGLWLTPRRQQSFKWRTLKPEYASWKDMPQDAAAVVHWNDRMQFAYLFDADNHPLPLDETKLDTLVQRYSIKYVLLDMRVFGQKIPNWERLYPTADTKRPIYVILKAPESIDVAADPQ